MNGMKREPNEPIPPSLRMALDVREEDYLRARRQYWILWGGTVGSGLLLFALWFVGPGVRIAIRWAGLTCITVHVVLRLVLREASKMETLKYRRYRELRGWRAGRARWLRRAQGREVDSEQERP